MSTLEDEMEEVLMRSNLKFCPKCIMPKTLGDVYCGTCGSLLKPFPMENRTCIKCGNELDVIDLYCTQCGGYLGHTFKEAR